MKDIVSFSGKKQSEGRSFIWSDIINEVAKRKAMGLRDDIFSDKEDKIRSLKPKKEPLKKYGLGAKYDDVWFTRREAECMFWLLKNNTTDEIAMQLGLSLRTVMDHVERMREKTGCCTTPELLALVCDSEFLKGVDF